MSTLNFVNTAEQSARLNQVIENHLHNNSSLLSVLKDAQAIYGYLPLEVQETIAEKMSLPLNQIFGVIYFHSQFSITPKGQYRISVCMGPSCHSKNSTEILNKLKKLLSIDINECTADGKFSLDISRCVKCCELSPLIMINDDVYGKLTIDDLENILSKYTNI